MKNLNYELQKIDNQMIDRIAHLEHQDECFFFDRYDIRMGHKHSKMNQLILNFKKSMNKKNNTAEWQHKIKAINEIVQLIIAHIGKFSQFTWIPIPPSKTKSHPEHDDRLWQVLTKVKQSIPSLDIRNLLFAQEDREAAHISNDTRKDVAYHINNLRVDEKNIPPNPNSIILFDDMVTSGTQYKAAKTVLRRYFPQMQVVGFFIAKADDSAHVQKIFSDNQ